MQWKATLLITVAIVSGLTCVVHMYLISITGHNYIKVALEIPLLKTQQSTNLELNIQSIHAALEANRGQQARSEEEAARQAQRALVDIPLRHEEVRESDLGEDWDSYGVLLDTGEYELVERDMDQTTIATGKQTKAKQSRQMIKSLHTTESAPNTERLSREVSENVPSKLRRASVETQPTVSGNDSSKLNDKRHILGPYIMSKEEFARQATARQATATTSPPPTTHHYHPTLSNTSHLLPKCAHPPCLQYLTDTERAVFNKCAVPRHSSHITPQCQCWFKEGRGNKRVALVSLPGSGNTWVRGLLEKATGLCTGSIYCDKTLREGGFCGEGLRGSSLVAVKTHDSPLQWRGATASDPSRPEFDKAIFLIRNPFKACIAEWNRQVSKRYAPDQAGSSHIKYVSSKAFFGEQAAWQAQVRYQVHKWKIMIGSNMGSHSAGRPVLIVFFEELKMNPAPQLARMIEFLELPISPAAISVTVMDGFTAYYRNHTDSFSHYTSEQRVFVNSVIASTADSLHDLGIARHLREYIQY